MSIRVEIDTVNGYALTHLEGELRRSDLRDAFDAFVSHREFDPDLPAVWMMGNASLVNLTEDDLHYISAYVGKNARRNGARLAFVVGRDSDFAIARMWLVISQANAPRERRIFRRLEDAVAWVSEEPAGAEEPAGR